MISVFQELENAVYTMDFYHSWICYSLAYTVQIHKFSVGKDYIYLAWFDVFQENYQSDQLDTVQTAEYMKTDVSLILLKQVLFLPLSHLFWRVGGYLLFRQVKNIFKGCCFGRMLQLSVNWCLFAFTVKRDELACKPLGHKSHQNGSCVAYSAFQGNWSRHRTKCTDTEEQDTEKNMYISV